MQYIVMFLALGDDALFQSQQQQAMVYDHNCVSTGHGKHKIKLSMFQRVETE